MKRPALLTARSSESPRLGTADFLINPFAKDDEQFRLLPDSKDHILLKQVTT